MPGVKPSEAAVKIGKGPAITLKDGISFINPTVRKWLEDSARKTKIGLQYEVISGAAADSSVTPMIREGIPSGGVFVPTRHIHSTCEVADLKDIEGAVKLVIEAVKSANRYF